jgi:hypothetical protein
VLYTKKATGFLISVAQAGSALWNIHKKKPRGLEFARGLVVHLGETKYQQAHSATMIHCHQQRQTDHEALS